MKDVTPKRPKRTYWCRECNNEFTDPALHFYKRGPKDPEGSVWVCPYCKASTEDWVEITKTKP